MAGYLSELENSAAELFYSNLEDGRFTTTRCPECDHTFFPPRTVCPRCLGAGVEWVELPGEGTIYAFTQQHAAMLHTKPEVVGAIELDGCTGRVFALIDSPFEELRIGMHLELELFRSPLGMTLYRLRPIRQGA